LRGMRIGVISDTHMTEPQPLLEMVVETYFKNVDLILHAGDLTRIGVLDAFAGKEVIAVAGNSDSLEVKQRLPEKITLPVNHFKIGMIHGWGFPVGLERRLDSSFEGLHCLVYGHSHRPANHYRDGVLYFNPGAFCGGIFSLWRRTVGILTIERNIRGDIIRLP
jgi:putative phosphoesterase